MDLDFGVSVRYSKENYFERGSLAMIFTVTVKAFKFWHIVSKKK